MNTSRVIRKKIILKNILMYFNSFRNPLIFNIDQSEQLFDTLMIVTKKVRKGHVIIISRDASTNRIIKKLDDMHQTKQQSAFGRYRTSYFVAFGRPFLSSNN